MAARAGALTEAARTIATRSRALPLVYVFLGGLAIFCVVPFAWIVLASVDPSAGVHLQIPAWLDLSAYTRFLTDPMFSRFLLNSLIMAGGSTVLVILTSALAGYALSRFTFRGRRVLMFAILLTRIIPVSATIAPLYLIVQWLKLVDTYQGLILVLAAQSLPLAIWLMKGFFDTVPGELEEAAWVDGASRLGERPADRPAPRRAGRRGGRAVRLHRGLGRLPDPVDPHHLGGQDPALDRALPGVQYRNGRLGAC